MKNQHDNPYHKGDSIISPIVVLCLVVCICVLAAALYFSSVQSTTPATDIASIAHKTAAMPTPPSRSGITVHTPPRPGTTQPDITPNKARLTANDVAKLMDKETSATNATDADDVKTIWSDIDTKNEKLSKSANFAQLLATLANEKSFDIQSEKEKTVRTVVRNYLQKARHNGEDALPELLDMIGQENDPYVKLLLASVLAEAVTKDEVNTLLQQWDDAQKNGKTETQKTIGAVMGQCTTDEQTKAIAEYIATNPLALEYFGTAPGENGSSLGINVILDAFACVPAGSDEAAALAATVDRVQGAQAVVALDAVMNMPRDEEQRVAAATILAEIGSTDAIRSLADSLQMAQEEQEVETFSAALASVSNPDGINDLANRLLSSDASTLVAESCARALNKFPEKTLLQYLGKRYSQVMTAVANALGSSPALTDSNLQ